MTAEFRPTQAAPGLPAAAPTETERTNEEAAPLDAAGAGQRSHALALPGSSVASAARTRRALLAAMYRSRRRDRAAGVHGAATILPDQSRVRQRPQAYRPGRRFDLQAGDAAKARQHTPNASRGDLTPAGARHGNDPETPALRIDALDSPLPEYAARQAADDETPPNDGPSKRLCGAVGPRTPSSGSGTSPAFRRSGVRAALDGLRDVAGIPRDAATTDFSDPATAGSSSRTLGPSATLLRPCKTAAETRSTAGARHAAITGKGRTEVDGESPEWSENDPFAAPGHAWRRFANETEDMIAYDDRLLVEEVERYRRQGRVPALES